MIHQTHHLNYQAHLCSNTYKTLKSEKKNTKEKINFHDGESMKMIYMNCLSKNYYPQGHSNTDENCDRIIKPLKCPRHRFFFFFFFFFYQKKGNELNYPKTHTKQRTEDKDKHALTPNRNALTTLTHNSPHK